MKRVSVKVSPINGKGVFADEGIAKGKIILAIDDSRIIESEDVLDPARGEHKRHCDYIDAGIVYMAEPERYINHCCEPSGFVKWTGGKRYVLAYRGIAEGEEITYDYCIDSDSDVIWECNCGHEKCRKTISADFYALSEEKLREYLPLLSEWFIESTRDRYEKMIHQP